MTSDVFDSETPAQGQQVITACALIHHTFDGVIKVYLPKRAATKKFLPGVYEIPGGHIDYGENIIRGLQREIREELGVNISVGDPFAVFDYTNPIKGSHSVEIIYFASLLDAPEAISLDPQIHDSGKWFSVDETDFIRMTNRDVDDAEILAIQKGFAILHGGKLNIS